MPLGTPLVATSTPATPGAGSRDLAGALYTLGEAERELGQAAQAWLLFQRAAAAFGATPASDYLDAIQREAEAAHRACQTGKPSAPQ